jgi:O-antigen/teichoic acid export membrane protein
MSIKKNVIYNTILTISNVAFPIITTPYISRILGVKNIGIVNFAINYTSYFALVAALGIPLYGIREIAKHNDDLNDRNQVFSELFIINCVSTIISSLIYLVSIFSISTLYRDREFLLIAGILIFFVPFNTDWFFSGREKFKLVTIRSLATKLISFGGLFIFVRTREDIVPYLILTIVANLSSQIWNFGYMLRKEVKIRFNNLQIKKHLKSILILFSSHVAISIYTLLNTLMLGFMSDYIQVGYYTSAIKISKITLPIVISMSPVIIARINILKGISNNQEQISILLNRSFGFMMMLAIPATIGLIMIAPRFVPVFFGSEFIPSTASMQLLSSLVIIIGLSNFFGMQILVALGHEKKFLIAILFGTITSFFLNLLLIGHYGSFGASIASVVAETMVTIATFIFSLKVVAIHIKKHSIIHPILAALPIIPVSLWVNHIVSSGMGYLLITVVLSGILYFFIMTFIFKNDQANQIISSITKSIKKYRN